MPTGGHKVESYGGKMIARGAGVSTYIAKKDQLRFLQGECIVTSAEKAEDPFTFIMAPGGHIAFAAKNPREFGAGGSIFPIAAVEVTEDGVVPLAGPGRPLPKDYEPLRWGMEISSVEPGEPEPVPGTIGLALRGSEIGDVENNYFIPINSKIISHWSGPDFNSRSTIIYDIGPKGGVSEKHKGPLEHQTVVTYSPLLRKFVPLLNGSPDTTPGTEVSTYTRDPAGLVRRVFARTGDLLGTSSFIVRPGTYAATVLEVYRRTYGDDVIFGRSTVTTSTPGEGFTGLHSLRYIEDAARSPRHVYHMSDNLLGDGEFCEKHIYARGRVTRDDGTYTTVECASHAPTGLLFKIPGDVKFDAPLEFKRDLWKAGDGPGRLIETKLKLDDKASHEHRGKSAIGKWKWETRVPAQRTTTPGPNYPQLSVDPTQCLQPWQAPACIPLPTPNTFGNDTRQGLGATRYPLNDTAWDTIDTKKIPYVGGDYSFAHQNVGGQFIQYSKPTDSPMGAFLGAGGVIKLPPDVFPTSRGSKLDYERGSLFRDDFHHYRYRENWGLVNPLTGDKLIRDGFRRAMEGSTGAREILHRAFDAAGNETQSFFNVFNTGLRIDGALTLGNDFQPVLTAGSVIVTGDAFIHRVIGGASNRLDNIQGGGTNQLIAISTTGTGFTIRDNNITGGNIFLRGTNNLQVNANNEHYLFLGNYAGTTNWAFVGCC